MNRLITKCLLLFVGHFDEKKLNLKNVKSRLNIQIKNTFAWGTCNSPEIRSNRPRTTDNTRSIMWNLLKLITLSIRTHRFKNLVLKQIFDRRNKGKKTMLTNSKRMLVKKYLQ